MTPELAAAYDAAMAPFLQDGSAIKPENLRMKSWRYFVEINSGCNLHCPMCTCGNREGYEHINGTMNEDLLKQILDKIRNENNQAIVFLYGNSEPFLHQRLPECIQEVKSRGLRCEFSTNLNFIRRVEETLAARPDFIIVSVSGFTQDVYSRGHAGGSIEKVKENMKTLSEARLSMADPPTVCVNYHKYTDNCGDDQLKAMEDYARSLGFDFVTCIARAISMENAIQYLRHQEKEKTGSVPDYAVLPGGPDYNQMLPPVSQQFIDNIKRLKISPEEAVEMFDKFPIHQVCPVGDAFTYVRHDGLVSMCACVADRRLTFGKFLEKSQEELSAQRRGHSICQQCLKYRMNLYFHIADKAKWDEKAQNV